MPLDVNYFNKWVYDLIDDYNNKVEVYYGGA